MKLTTIQKLNRTTMPWVFGAILFVSSFVTGGPSTTDFLLRSLVWGVACLLITLSGTNSLLAKLVEGDTKQAEATSPGQ